MYPIRDKLEAESNQGLLLPNEDQVRIPIGVTFQRNIDWCNITNLLNVLERALRGCGFDADNFRARLWLTEFGESYVDQFYFSSIRIAWNLLSKRS